MQYRRSCERRDLALLGKIDKWAAPKYWAEVEYRDITTDGLLRMWRFVVCTPIGRLRPRSSASSRLLRRSVVSFIASLRIAKKAPLFDHFVGALLPSQVLRNGCFGMTQCP